MELGLSLQSLKPISSADNSQKNAGKDLGFCMAVDGKVCSDDGGGEDIKKATTSSSDPPLQLRLLPFSPPSNNSPFIWLTQNLLSEERPAHSSPNSTVSPFLRSKRINIYLDSARKKLRLSKHQSAFLEDSFKLHSTLNLKEKVSLAKRLNLRPRQVEVWFQNRRARRKLKQTEVDCEYLNKYCKTLREENKRLQKELQQLRPLNPFYIPATTLTMCPSCQRLATAAVSGAGAGGTI